MLTNSSSGVLESDSFRYILNVLCYQSVPSAITMSSPGVLESLSNKRTAVRLSGLPLILLSFQTLGQWKACDVIQTYILTFL